VENYIVSARKYRPARFDDVVGQEHITTTLKNALSSHRVAQAFLFCGPRGVGKTTCARILAKVINCENTTKDFDACGACAPCRSFIEGASMNIFELDAASNNSVDDIRTLTDQVRYAPQLGKYKVYIIDEVHMLSQAAFNAFLKTLEEPPPHAIFILATTEKHKIIPTILSRCQIYDFNRMGIAEMVSHLQGIAAKEKITTDEDALHIIAEKADGAMRDALSIFDKLVSFSPEGVNYTSVLKNLHILDYDYYFRITESLITQNTGEALLILDEILKKGFSGDIFLEGFAQHLRNLYVLQIPATIKLLEVSDKQKERYAAQATLISPSFLVTGLNIINQFGQQYKSSENKRMEIELCLLKLAYAQEVLKIPFKFPEAKPLLPASGTKKNDGIKLASPPTVKQETAAKSISESSQNPPQPAPKLLKEQSPPQYGKSVKINLFSVMEEEEESASIRIPLADEWVNSEWKNHISTLTSESVRNVCYAYPIQIKNSKICFEVNSVMHETMLRKELPSFFEKLRLICSEEELAFEITILARAEEDQHHPRFLGPKDRYIALLKENPLLEKLKDSFDLRIDF